ncbi:MAG: adenylate/guanylate cyclase domain-containing protein [Acidimicrobiia bacterium]|nr:adenylate/guanylate cyclase domain-containing protein [Acidimicrobiia bacterium]
MITDRSTERVALNADVVGYSALVADDLEATTATMTAYHQLVETEIAANDGTLANFVGDSFMAVFGDAMAGLRTAIAITTEIEERNADLPQPRQVRFRMGMDQGSVTAAEGKYHGDALNTAARIQTIAPAGGLAVSGPVYQALDEPALRFRAMGRQRLKNIPEQVDVYEFVDLPSDGRHRAMRRSLALESPTLAILPIHTEMVDDTVRATAGMIRRDLLHRLSVLPDLEVVDAPSEPSGPQGSGARYMVETGVHQFGNNVRVFAVLFDMDTMNVVKSHKWMTTVEEMFTVSEELADEVAHSVEVELVIGEPARLYAELDDPAAIEKVYLGWYHLRNETKEGWHRALELFGDVSRSHPDRPYGFTLSAFALWLGASNRWTADPEAAFDQAVELARKGSAGGDPTGMAQAVEAAVLMSRGEVDEALARLEHLEIVRPTCDVTYGLEGSIRRYLGEWERAVELLDVAMRLTGINKPWYPTVKASSLFVGGRLDEAASLAEGVLDYQPNNLEALLVLAAAQVEQGLDRRARATSELIKERFPAIDVEEWLDKTPYQRREIVERWKGDLMSAGAIAGI